MLDKNFALAENILIQHDEIEEAMMMYQGLHRWDESIKIAERYKHQDVDQFKSDYFKWLLETNQEAKAAEVKERSGDYLKAIQLYLKGGLPAKAANVVTSYNVSIPQDQLEMIATRLTSSQMYEKAGDFYEKMQDLKRALEQYRMGHCYRKAVDLSKRA